MSFSSSFTLRVTMLVTVLYRSPGIRWLYEKIAIPFLNEELTIAAW